MSEVRETKDAFSICEFAWLFLILFLVGFVFHRVLSYPFLNWDDYSYVMERFLFRRIAQGDLKSIWLLLSPDQVLAGGVVDYNPMRDLSYALDAWRAGQITPSTFHQSNLILHLCNVGLLYGLGRRFGLRVLYASFAALLFGIHPLTVEPVAWVSGRKDLLYVCFGMCSLHLFWAMLTAKGFLKKGLFYLSFGLFFVAALGSKGPAVSFLPLAALLLLMPRFRMIRWKATVSLIPFVVITASWVLWSIQWGRKAGNILAQKESGFALLFRAFGAPARAMERFFFPFGLSPNYGDWSALWWQDRSSWISVFIVLALSYCLLRFLKHREFFLKLVFMLTAMTLAILPTSGLVRVGQVQADRFLYITTALLSLMILYWLQAYKKKSLVFAGVIGFVFLCGWQNFEYQQAWKGDRELWVRAYEVNPHNALANRMLGLIAYEQRRMLVARKLLQRSVTLAPQDARGWRELGRYWITWTKIAYRKKLNPSWQKSFGFAQKALRKALVLQPKYDLVWCDLGNLWLDRASVAVLLKEAAAPSLLEAQKGFEKAQQFSPQRVSYLYNLGLVATRQKRFQEAENFFRKALSPDKQRVVKGLIPKVLYALGAALWEQGKTKKANDLIRRESQRYPQASKLFQRWFSHYKLSKQEASLIHKSKRSSPLSFPTSRKKKGKE